MVDAELKTESNRNSKVLRAVSNELHLVFVFAVLRYLIAKKNSKQIASAVETGNKV
jgi:hypothetical protein